MMSNTSRAAALVTVPRAAHARTPEPSPRAPAAMIAGLAKIVLDEPNTVGHPVWFGIQAVAAPDGTALGPLQYRHQRADGSLVGQGWAEVTCLRVTGDATLLAAVVPEGVGPIRNHGCYFKIADGAPDVVRFVQAANGTERPPRDCVDPDVAAPGQVVPYPVRTGGFVVHGG